MIRKYHPDFSGCPWPVPLFGKFYIVLIPEILQKPENITFYLTIIQGIFLLDADFETLGNSEVFPLQSLSSSNYAAEKKCLD